MKWAYKEPTFADIIRVKIGSIYHMGIYVSDTEVIQFGLPPSRRDLFDKDISVLATSIDEFLDGGFLEVGVPEKKEIKKLRKKQEIVQTARGKLGEKGYHILNNNCEHFVNECAFGEKFSAQTDFVRKAFQQMPILDVYVSEIPSEIEFLKLFPDSRQQELESISNIQLKKQKYCVWKLFEYALNRSLGLKIQNINLTKSSGGKWISDQVYFSLSHSDNLVCVAISKKAVGIDIEKLEIRNEKLCDKILNNAEMSAYKSIIDDKNKFLIVKWTQKESIFKLDGKKSFVPKKIDTTKIKTFTKSIFNSNEEYVLSVAGKDLEKIRIYENVIL